jgi:hypothetical protein
MDAPNTFLLAGIILCACGLWIGGIVLIGLAVFAYNAA